MGRPHAIWTACRVVSSDVQTHVSQHRDMHHAQLPHDDARHVSIMFFTLMDMIVHCHRLMRVADRSPAPQAHPASSRRDGWHVVQMACGQPMCLQPDSCSWRAMFGMCLTASSHCPAAWKQPTCSQPRPYAPQLLQIEACHTCVASQSTLSLAAPRLHWFGSNEP